MTQPLVSVKYIGKRPEYTEGTYGTRIHFVQGESRMVPADKAKLMLRHADVYEPGDKDAPVAEVADSPVKEDDAVQDMRDAINIMGKEALTDYAKTNFGTSLDQRKGVDALRAKVTGLIDQYGVK
jgi:hypothetical protein